MALYFSEPIVPVIMHPFSLLILFCFSLPLLARVSSISILFPKNQFFVLSIFLNVFMSFSLFPALILMVYVLSTAFGFDLFLLFEGLKIFFFLILGTWNHKCPFQDQLLHPMGLVCCTFISSNSRKFFGFFLYVFSESLIINRVLFSIKNFLVVSLAVDFQLRFILTRQNIRNYLNFPTSIENCLMQ